VADAHDQVRLARRLRTMPATATAALAAGDITAGHAHRLAALDTAATATAFAAAEETLVGQARTMRWADFTKACAYWARAARHDAPDPDRSDHDHRHVALHDGLRGTGLLTGELTPTAKATVRAALERIERELFDTDWAAAKAVHGDTTTSAHLARTPRQRRHDALVDMATRASTAPPGAQHPRPLPGPRLPPPRPRLRHRPRLAPQRRRPHPPRQRPGPLRLPQPPTRTRPTPSHPPPRAAPPPDTPSQPDPRRLARLELARQRIRDRCLHDPHWAT
jgi:hypothetical protein